MPITKLFSKKENKESLLEDGSGPSKKEQKAHIEQENLNKLLNKYNFSDNNYIKISNYLTRVLNMARVSKNKKLETYFETQQNRLIEFRKLLNDINKLNLELTKIKNPKIRAGVEHQIHYLNTSINKLGTDYSKSKITLQKEANSVDNGPYLTKDGLVFSPHHSESESETNC